MNDLKFPFSSVYNVRVFELRPTLREIPGAVQRTDDAFVVNFKQCLNCEICRLEVQYIIDSGLLETLVHWRSSPEPLKDETIYNLSAQLTDPDGLVKGFSEVEINEYPVTTRVYVKQYIDVAIPGLKTFKELRALESAMFSNYNPREGWKLASMQHERAALQRRLKEENPREVLRALNMLLLPAHFRTYLSLRDHVFRYHEITWGVGRMEMPDNAFLPEELNVITRTDLGLNKLASNDVLHYDSGKFAKDVDDALKENVKLKKRKKFEKERRLS